MRNVTKYLSALILLLSMLVISYQGRAQTTLLTEGWEAAVNNSNTPPAGWGLDVILGSNITYYMSVGQSPTVNPFEGSRLVDFESYSYSSGTNRLKRTTAISTVGYNNITVDFEWYTDNGYAGYTLEGVTVQWSTNGTVWTDAGSLYMRYDVTNQWVLETQALPVGAANQATLYVAFQFNSEFGDDCHMDIIHVKGLQTGTITGTVRNCYNNNVLAGVPVFCGGVGPINTNAGGVYTIPGVPSGTQNISTGAYAGFVALPPTPVTIIGNSTVTYNFCLNPIPGVLSGVITNCANGNPIVGAKIVWSGAGNPYTYSTGPNGAYSFTIYPGATGSITVTKEGFVNGFVGGLNVVPPATVTQNVCLNENTPPPSQPFTAVLNAGQTAVNLNWGLPFDDMVLIYDDGIQENFVIWTVGTSGNQTNRNAVKFTPISYPTVIKQFYVNVGAAGNYVAPMSPLFVAHMSIYDASGPGGLPGVEVSPATAFTPTGTGWMKANFDAPVTITSGNFYIVMTQIGDYQHSPGLGVDTTTQQLRSYSNFNNTGWIPGPGNYMIRAVVNGTGGPLLMDNSGSQPITASAVPNLTYQYAPATVTGTEGNPKVYPETGYNPDNLLGYQVWRLTQGQEATPALWTSGQACLADHTAGEWKHSIPSTAGQMPPSPM
jgi:hypothetical protein